MYVRSGRRSAGAALLMGLGLLTPLPSAAGAEAQAHGRSAAGWPLHLHPCQFPGVDGPAGCGTLTVFEDRAAAVGRTIGLRIVVLPALTELPALDPLFILAGGPGQAATVEAVASVERLAPVRAERDIILVDVRGTGGSNPLDCTPRSPQELLDLLAWRLADSLVAECLRSFDADPTFYTTALVVDDLDDVRAALGYEQVSLYGTSYGSRAALVYARRFPERVRALVLNSPVPPNVPIPLLPALHGQVALDGRFSACAHDVECASRFPDPAADLAAVLVRLSAAPANAAFVDPVTGDTTDVRVTRDVFAGGLQFALYVPLLALRLPEVIHRAAAGDFAPFLQVATPMAAMLPHSIHLGMFFSVTCSEDAPAIERLSRETIVLATEGTFLGGLVMANHARVCARWPRAGSPAEVHEPVSSLAPTLLISGELDPITPPALARVAQRHLPNSRHLVLAGQGHGPEDDCVVSLIGRLLADGTVEGLDLGCPPMSPLEERGPS
jgi:pimeloyl-ACP methyl ester carboxylesterase